MESPDQVKAREHGPGQVSAATLGCPAMLCFVYGQLVRALIFICLCAFCAVGADGWGLGVCTSLVKPTVRWLFGLDG